MNLIDPKDYHVAISLLREFFVDRGFVEVPVQSRLSILAACEDPRTIATFDYAGAVYPLPQTGQVWLEIELLKNPSLQGVFCQSTSYRNEPNPIPGRHDLIFPMFEFEMIGTIDNLIELERELLVTLGFDNQSFYQATYDDLCNDLGTDEIDATAEERIWKEISNVCFITDFPVKTSPFWNMKMHQSLTHANKVDVILYGIETFGTAERSNDPDQMRNSFYSISNGMYADTLMARFGRERVQKELDEFLALPMIPRVGGGIGITRLIRALSYLEVEKGNKTQHGLYHKVTPHNQTTNVEISRRI